MLVVSDATPLISLMKASQLGLLESLFGRVLVPNAVYQELTTSERFREEAELVRGSSFIEVVFPNNQEAVQRLRVENGLDRGESEAIVYAEESGADRLLMDEELGRATAAGLGLRVMGTVGVLVKGYEEGYLSVGDVEKAFEDMKRARRHIGDSLIRDALDYVYE